MPDSKRQVVFLIESMQARAGTERVTASVASGLAERGLNIEILTLHGETSGFPLSPKVHLRTLGMEARDLRLRGDTVPLIRMLRKRWRQYPPEILITVDTFLAAFAFPALLGLNTRRIAWEHFQYFTDLGMRSRRLARQMAARLGHDVITLTPQDAQQWQQALPGAGAQIRAIANPLPFAPFSVNPYAPDRRTVLALGRLDPQKGFDLLLEAWSLIENSSPGWTLRIVGSGVERQKLERQIEALGLERCTLTPATPQVEQEYAQAGVFALSSRHEGLGMVLMESQAHGIPAVAFDCPHGPAELLEPGGGLLVSPGQVQAFAEALQTLMSQPDLRTELSDKAFHASERYNADTILDEWTGLLRFQSSDSQL